MRNKTKLVQLIEIIILSLITFTIYMSWMNSVIFADEQDVFYGGYNVVMSGDVYRNYASQHMPISYYLAAIGALLGARTVYQFRLYFYGLMTLLWAGIWIRNRKVMPKAGLFFLPAIYLFLLKNYAYATTMVSDHWQGIGLAMILVELVRFAKYRKIDAGTCFFVSLGIQLSFGCAFLSVYAIFAVMVGVGVMLLQEGKKNPEQRNTIAKETIRLVISCVAPVLLLCLWYAVSGNWNHFVDGAYRMNVDVYAKYARNYSNSVGESLAGMIPAWFESITSAIGAASQNPVQCFAVILQVACLGYVVFRIWRMSWIAAITYLAATLFSGIRGYGGFHAAPYVACVAVSIACCIGWMMEGCIESLRKRGSQLTDVRQDIGGEKKRKRIRSKKRNGSARWVSLACGISAVMIMIGLSIPSWTAPGDLAYAFELVGKSNIPEDSQELLGIITEPGQRIHTGDLSMTSDQVMAYNLRLDDACLGSGNPWFYEIYGQRALAALKENQTSVVMLYPEIPIWGYSMEDYASDLMAYVRQNYTELEHGLYVHHNALRDVSARLWAVGYGLIGRDLTEEGSIPWTWQQPGQTDEQYLIAEGSQMMAVQLRTEVIKEENRAGIRAVLREAESGEVIAECALSHDQLAAEGWTRFPLNAETIPGKGYKLCFETEDNAGMTMLRTYRTLDNTATENFHAFVNGMDMDYNLAVRIEYGVDDQCGILQ